MLPTKFRFNWLCSFREEDFQKSTNLKQELPAVAIFVNESGRNEQSLQKTFYRCFLPSFSSFGKVISEEKIFQKSTNQNQELPVVAMFINGSGRNQQFLQKTFHRCFLPNCSSFGKAVIEEKTFQKSTNQKQEWPVVAMFVNGSELNEQCFQRTFQGCFLPSFDLFGKVVSEEKIFRSQPIRNKNCLWWQCFYESGRNEQSLQRTFLRCFLPSFDSFF